MRRGTRCEPRKPAAPVTRTRCPASEPTLGEQRAVPRDRLGEPGIQIVCGPPVQAFARLGSGQVLIANLALRDIADIGLEIRTHEPSNGVDDVEYTQRRFIAEV